MTVKYKFSTEYDESVGVRVAQGIRSQRHQVAPEFFETDGNPIGSEDVNITLYATNDTLIGGLIGSTLCEWTIFRLVRHSCTIVSISMK